MFGKLPGIPETDSFQHTDPPEYTTYVSDNSGVNDDSPAFQLEYDRNVKSKFLAVIFGVILFFIWFGFFIDDTTWYLLGFLVAFFSIVFYRFRICRIIHIDHECVIQRNGRRKWDWKWKEIHSITEKYTASSGEDVSRMRRLILIHESGRDICFDSHMKHYNEAARFVLQTAKQHNVKIEQNNIPFFVLIYW